MEPFLPAMAFVLGLVGFLSVAGAVMYWARSLKQEREAFYRSETFKKVVESTGSTGDAALEFLREQERLKSRRARDGMKLGGLMICAAGTGLMIFLHAVDPREPAYLVGLIPLLVGVALLLYVYVLGPKE